MTTHGRTEGSAAPEDGVRRSPLSAAFYDRPAATVARELLGCRVVSLVGGERCAGVIVETEGYTGPDDEASHAHIRFGRTRRNEVMFGPAGFAYVYLIYGMHWCLNAVTGAEGFPAAVLIRAAIPVEGVEAVRARRSGRADRELMRGPGNLCTALGITGAVNGSPLQEPPVWIEAGAAVPESEVAIGPRIGISRAVEDPLRFWVRGDQHVSRGR